MPSIYQIAERVKYPRQITMFPGTFTFEVFKFMMDNRLSSRGSIWYVNVTALVTKHTNKRVLRVFDLLRRNYGLKITKPTNRQYLRPNVWVIDNYEKVRFYAPPSKEEGRP